MNNDISKHFVEVIFQSLRVADQLTWYEDHRKLSGAIYFLEAVKVFEPLLSLHPVYLKDLSYDLSFCHEIFNRVFLVIEAIDEDECTSLMFMVFHHLFY